MKRIVISGSAKLQNKIQNFRNAIIDTYEILDYPKFIQNDKFIDLYPQIHRDFYENIASTDVFLLFNYDKNGVEGYIGSAGFAELCFAVAQNQVYNKNIEIYIYKLPDVKVHCYDEIKLYLQFGWIKLWNK